MSALLTAKQRGDPGGWRAFQERVHALKNQRTRAKREVEDLETSLFAAQTALRLQDEGALGKKLRLSLTLLVLCITVHIRADLILCIPSGISGPVRAALHP